MTWKETNEDTRHGFRMWLGNNSVERMDLGRANYGDTYQGSPLKEAKEELLDGLFAVYMLERREQALTELIQAVKAQERESGEKYYTQYGDDKRYWAGHMDGVYWVLERLKEIQEA